MKCFFCRNLLSDYLENVLDGRQTKDIQAHLRTCSSCANYYESLLSGDKKLKQIELFDPGDTLYTEIKKHIQGNSWLYKNYRRFFMPLRVKLPLLFLVIFTVAIITGFVLIEKNKFVDIARVNLELFDTKSTGIDLQPETKQTAKDFSEDIKPILKVPEKVEIEKVNKGSTITENKSKEINADEEDKLIEKRSTATAKAGTNEGLQATNKDIFKVFLNSSNLDADTEKVRKIVLFYGAVKASRSDIGTKEESGSYFHIYVPQKNFDPMIKEIKDDFEKLTVQKEQSERVVTGFRYRVIIWIENLNKGK